ncbi:hypothetical protein HU200_006606 [Digitaria exilis]|uniref:Uncharacterized protein n=1 Tax=Digitaria exilis TaxID=1010633 RepID=A0A835KT84_9POAL|nr:hypothetical protein HU200_006606 [Digitaria exilis]
MSSSGSVEKERERQQASSDRTRLNFGRWPPSPSVVERRDEMAPKRKKSHVDGKVESQDGSAANLGDMSTFDFAKPVYLVAEHEEHEGEKTAYSIFKVNASATTGGTKSLRVHTIAGLPNTTRGMSFVTAHSKLGSWIVGVGGKSRAGTIILDPSTLETSNPVLISLADEVYVLSRQPRVVPGIDFEPWFYSLSFKEEIPIGDGTWEKVHSENLPFVGQGVPLGCGSLFNNGVTTASALLFHISIMATCPSDRSLASVNVLWRRRDAPWPLSPRLTLEASYKRTTPLPS